MFRRLLKWNIDRREWNRAHEETWAGVTEPTESGLSPFQLMCEPAVISALCDLGVTLIDREILKMDGQHSDMKDQYIKSRLSGTPWTLWVYSDAAEVTSENATLVRLEEWDAKTPEDFISTFVKELQNRVRNLSEKSV